MFEKSIPSTHKQVSFILLSDINNFPTPLESPDLMPIEMVWKDIKFYLVNNVKFKSKINLIGLGLHKKMLAIKNE